MIKFLRELWATSKSITVLHLICYVAQLSALVIWTVLGAWVSLVIFGLVYLALDYVLYNTAVDLIETHYWAERQRELHDEWLARWDEYVPTYGKVNK